MLFLEKLLAASRQQDSLLCVGLDPEWERLPPHLKFLPQGAAITRFCQEIIEATAPYVCAYKPNMAFYEALGLDGLHILKSILEAVPKGIPVILDAKRGDIGNTAQNYARAAFEVLNADAVTINPYMGYDSVSPFLDYKDKGVFLLCRTSNPGARDLQDLEVQAADGQVRPLYEAVAQRVQSWNSGENCGLVVGATYPEEMKRIRGLCPTLPILIPGIGAQGGDLEGSVRAGVDGENERAIISASRTVLYADNGADFAAAAANVASDLREQINKARRGSQV